MNCPPEDLSLVDVTVAALDVSRVGVGVGEVGYAGRSSLQSPEWHIEYRIWNIDLGISDPEDGSRVKQEPDRV